MSVPISVLQLERHFFTLIELKTNPDAKAEGVQNVVCTLEIKKASDDVRRHQVTLKVKIEKDEGSLASPYYSGIVEVVGFFKVAENCKHDVDKLVHISGASVLYGSVRELVCNLTARGPWPMVTLPTMNFTPQPVAAGPSETKGAEAETLAKSPAN